MKTLISKTRQTGNLKMTVNKKYHSSLPFAFCLLSFIFSSSTPFREEYQEKKDDTSNKKLELLEKLEAGKSVSSDEVRSSYAGFRFENMEAENHYYFDYDFEQIHDELLKGLEEMKFSIGSLRHSEEFQIMQKELMKLNEKFREEMEKVRDEFIRSAREKRSTGKIN